jgi:hypothetical protein
MWRNINFMNTAPLKHSFHNQFLRLERAIYACIYTRVGVVFMIGMASYFFTKKSRDYAKKFSSVPNMY